MTSVLKLGTRKSLLAWAQSGWVAQEVEKNNPGIKVERVGLETRGDRILDIPLRKVEGKEFFVAEIDHALRSREVDFTVHSLKDLSLDRPSDFYCGAIPKRENPRDIILFSPQVLTHLKSGKRLTIGTSSPRRLENIPEFLKRALPRVGPHPSELPQLEWVEIRGNVNTRVGRLHETPDSQRYLDGVVLAFAGLIRLWADLDGRDELKKLLKNVRWMVLPLKECPSAPGQGALAVECRADDLRVRNILSKIHHAKTASAVELERALLAESGGGCHQRFGATAISHPQLGELLWIRGRNIRDEALNEVRWRGPESQDPKQKWIAWDGTQWKSSFSKIQVDAALLHSQSQAYFVAHSRGLPDAFLLSEVHQQRRFWTSGVESWFKLASQGLWIEGCAEGLGFEGIQMQVQEPVLGLPDLKNWTVLTHAGALSGWEKFQCQVVASYEINRDYGSQPKIDLQVATHLFWSSGSQFLGLKEWVNSHAIHACGAGKTVNCLRENGIRPWVFPTVEEWRKWINQRNKNAP